MRGCDPVTGSKARIVRRRGCENRILAIEESSCERDVPIVVDDRQIDKAESDVVDEITGHCYLRDRAA